MFHLPSTPGVGAPLDPESAVSIRRKRNESSVAWAKRRPGYLSPPTLWLSPRKQKETSRPDRWEVIFFSFELRPDDLIRSKTGPRGTLLPVLVLDHAAFTIPIDLDFGESPVFFFKKKLWRESFICQGFKLWNGLLSESFNYLQVRALSAWKQRPPAQQRQSAKTGPSKIGKRIQKP